MPPKSPNPEERFRGAPITEDIAPALRLSREWRAHAWAAYNPLYWLCWLGSAGVKTLGRWALRLASLNRVQLEPLPDESQREFELRTFWVLPMSGWFAVALLVSLFQLAAYGRVYPASPAAGGSGADAPPHPMVGAATRLTLSAAFVGGNAALLEATRCRDLPLLQACTAGFLAFSASFALLTAYAAARFATQGLFAEPQAVLEMGFSAMGVVLYCWQAAVCCLLRAEYAARADRRPWPSRVEADDDGRCGALAGAVRCSPLLGVSVLVSVLVVTANLASISSDPHGFFSVIG